MVSSISSFHSLVFFSLLHSAQQRMHQLPSYPLESLAKVIALLFLELLFPFYHQIHCPCIIVSQVINIRVFIMYRISLVINIIISKYNKESYRMSPSIEKKLYANSLSSSVNASIALQILLLYGDFK